MAKAVREVVKKATPHGASATRHRLVAKKGEKKCACSQLRHHVTTVERRPTRRPPPAPAPWGFAVAVVVIVCWPYLLRDFRIPSFFFNFFLHFSGRGSHGQTVTEDPPERQISRRVKIGSILTHHDSCGQGKARPTRVWGAKKCFESEFDSSTPGKKNYKLLPKVVELPTKYSYLPGLYS